MPSPTLSRRTLLRGLASGIAAGAAGCTAFAESDEPAPLPDATPSADDWPTAGYDARNSRYNGQATPPRSTPTPRWTHDFRTCYAPMVRGTRVVLNAEDRTVGLRATDGELSWRSDAEPWGFETPTLGRERAFVTGTDCVFGPDLTDGEETWHGRPCHGANTASGTVANGRLYLEYGGYFSALDATGRVTWATSHDVNGSPAIVGETAYVATAFTAEAVDLTATAREWPWGDPDDDDPAHADREESTEWSVPPEPRSGGPRVHYSPAVSGATVYLTVERAGRPGGELRAVARDTGEQRWTVASPPDRRATESAGEAPDPVRRPVAPVVTDDLVVTSLGDRRLQAFTPGGESVWSRLLDHAVTDLVGAGDSLVALTHDRSVDERAPGHASVVALDLGSGSVRWRRDFPDHVVGLAVAGGTVYVSAVTDRGSDGDVVGMRLYALG